MEPGALLQQVQPRLLGNGRAKAALVLDAAQELEKTGDLLGPAVQGFHNVYDPILPGEDRT